MCLFGCWETWGIYKYVSCSHFLVQSSKKSNEFDLKVSFFALVWLLRNLRKGKENEIVNIMMWLNFVLSVNKWIFLAELSKTFLLCWASNYWWSYSWNHKQTIIIKEKERWSINLPFMGVCEWHNKEDRKRKSI